MTSPGIGMDRRRQRRGPVPLAEIVAKAIGPLAARRGFGAADLIAAWPEIVGARFAECTRPDRIVWPKGATNEGRLALLVVRVDGPAAVLFQHEAAQVVERANAFLGYAAIGQLRIVQGPVGKAGGDKTHSAPAAISADDEARLGQTLAPVDSDTLRTALDRLGRGVLAERRR